MSLATKFGAGNAAELTAPSRNDFSRAGEGTIAPRALSYHFGSGFVSLTAPTLTWTSAETVDPPTFNIDLTNPQEGDIVRLYKDGVLAGSHTLTAGELSSLTFDLGLTAWGNGTYSATAKHERGGVQSAASDPVVVTIAIAVATTFNTTPNAGSVTLSNGDRTVVFDTNNVSLLTVAAITGKKALTVTLDVYPGDNAGLGLATGDVGQNAGIFSGKSALYLMSGEIDGSTTITPVPNVTVGQSIAVLIDEPNAKAWWTKDGTNFYGSSTTPATQADLEAGTGGHDISAITALGTIYGIVGNLFGGAGQGFTMQTAYPWTLPSGYSVL